MKKKFPTVYFSECLSFQRSNNCHDFKTRGANIKKNQVKDLNDGNYEAEEEALKMCMIESHNC